jgi:hypothetical protein
MSTGAGGGKHSPVAAVCDSALEQMRSKFATSIHNPPQCVHSSNGVLAT